MSISLPQVTVGQQTELWRILDNAGLTGEDVQAVLRDHTLAEHMVTELRRHLPLGNERLFSSCEDILASFATRSEMRGWPFDEDDFSILAESMPGFQTDRLKAACLKIWLGSPGETAHELWEWAKSVHDRRVGGDSGITFNSRNVHLLNPDRYGRGWSAEWEIIDLSHAWYEEMAPWHQDPAPVDADKIRRADRRFPADLEVLTVAALHPQYIRAQNGRDIPFLSTGGVYFYKEDGSEQPYVLRLGWRDESQQIWLSLEDPQMMDLAFVAPVIM